MHYLQRAEFATGNIFFDIFTLIANVFLFADSYLTLDEVLFKIQRVRCKCQGF